MTVSFQQESSGPTTKARTGRLHTPHGDLPTPVFMAVGTQGSVKAVAPHDLRALGTQMIVGNAYHLYLRPGHELVARLGGLHCFMGWSGPMLTDSGGFQVFSLAHIRHVSDEGVRFRSHVDGSQHFLSPEIVMEVEAALGADIAMVLDEPTAYPSTREEARVATDRTHRWAERCLASHTREGQALFGIVQGGLDPELRQQSARVLTEMGFAGYAIGGLSLGEPKARTWDMVDTVMPELPQEKVRYLMGVGSPEDVVEGIARGIDMFDSSFPTRVARNGALLTPQGRVNVTNTRYKEEPAPVMEGCDCATCDQFSAAYLHHLFHSRELLAYHLATIHNLRFMMRLVERAQQAIRGGTFQQFYQGFLAHYRDTDPEVRAEQKAKWVAGRRKQPVPPGTGQLGELSEVTEER